MTDDITAPDDEPTESPRNDPVPPEADSGDEQGGEPTPGAEDG